MKEREYGESLAKEINISNKMYYKTFLNLMEEQRTVKVFNTLLNKKKLFVPFFHETDFQVPNAITSQRGGKESSAVISCIKNKHFLRSCIKRNVCLSHRFLRVEASHRWRGLVKWIVIFKNLHVKKKKKKVLMLTNSCYQLQAAEVQQ